MNKKELKQKNIRLGTHGEDYGSWMSNPVFYIIGGIGVLAAVLAVLSFYVFHRRLRNATTPHKYGIFCYLKTNNSSLDMV